MKKILLGLTAVTFMLILTVGLLVWVDPFDLRVADRFGSDYDAALTAIPLESDVYMGVNLLNANLEQWQAFQTGDGGTAVADMQTEFETIMADEFGISIHEDMVPWLGQYLGVAILDVTLDEAGNVTAVEWLIVAETRNQDASDEFLTKLSAGFADQQGQSAQTLTHDDVDITVFDELAFTRSDNLVLVGSSATAVQSALDSQTNGQSLADVVGYAEAIAQLPADRFLTFFIPATQTRDLLAQLPANLLGVGAADVLPMALQGTAVALQAVPEGVQIDAISLYEESQLTAAQTQAIRQVSDSPASDLFPADTIAYFPGQSFATTWAYVREAMIATLGEADFDESMAIFGDNFGLNPDTDLFPLLDSTTAVALIPQQNNVALNGIDAQLGLAAAMSTENPAELDALVSNFNTMMVESGIGEIETVAGATAVYDFSTFLFPDLDLSYAIADDYLLLSNTPSSLLNLPTSGATLASTTDFQTVWQSFPDMTPGFYVNVAELATAVPELDELGVATAVSHIAGASTSQDNTITHRILIFIAD